MIDTETQSMGGRHTARDLVLTENKRTLATNTRTKKVEEGFGGKCDGETTMQESCNDQDCPGNLSTHHY